MRQPLVYVIVLNYNGRRWIEACVAALSETRYDNFRVVLVDNGSSDDSVELIRAEFPQVQIIANGANLGFSEGNNAGIREALASNADYVVLLNPDTKVQPEWLSELIAVAEINHDLGVLGAIQLEYDSPEFNSWTRNAAGEFLEELKDPGSARAWIPTEWVEGSCFAVRRKVFENVGLLDPIYFAFYEEIDFCRRAACLGYKIALVPRSRIHHHRGGNWEADPSIKRERDYRCDRGQFIFASTDPRNSAFRNFLEYVVTLGTKLKDAMNGFSPTRLLDLARIQVELITMSGDIIGKWRRDRARLVSENEWR